MCVTSERKKYKSTPKTERMIIGKTKTKKSNPFVTDSS
jgi:hypothetical protein